MPKVARLRTPHHAPSAKLSQRFAQNINSGPSEKVEIGSMAEASGSQILEAMRPEPPTQLKKKTKQQLKHQAFMERLQASQSPYSRSHNRRLKRKEKQQLGSGMDDLNAVLGAIDDPVEEVQQPGITTARRRDTSNEKPRVKPGQIGEGRGAPLTKAQRKKALLTERLRIPLVRSTPEFSKNPFETIRLHAQNTLVPHEVSKTASSS